MPVMSFSTSRETIIEAESSLTDRYQTTVPDAVRRALKLDRRDKIHYIICANGDVVLKRATPAAQEEDPALEPFLSLLERDIEAHPERLRPVSVGLLTKIAALTEGVEYNIDEPLPEED
ncbi:type II toxin-antitoxin system PrlF family antitoxin [Cupriavidus necator]